MKKNINVVVATETSDSYNYILTKIAAYERRIAKLFASKGGSRAFRLACIEADNLAKEFLWLTEGIEADETNITYNKRYGLLTITPVWIVDDPDGPGWCDETGCTRIYYI